MKKLVLILAAAAFMGCGKQNGPSPISNSSLIDAQWYYTVDTVRTYTNGNLQLISAKSYPSIHTNADYVKFNADGTGSQFISASGNTLSFNYSLSGNSVTLTYPSQTVLGATTTASTETAAIKQLTGTNLSLFFDSSVTASSITTRTTEAAYFVK